VASAVMRPRIDLVEQSARLKQSRRAAKEHRKTHELDGLIDENVRR